MLCIECNPFLLWYPPPLDPRYQNLRSKRSRSSNCLEGQTKQALEPGNWGLNPAGVEHQELKEGVGEVSWAILLLACIPTYLPLSASLHPPPRT
jgi:hypothetical protein